MASQFSVDGKYFAQLSVDGKLKIWETNTNKLEQEFTPDFHLTTPCTCLHFIQSKTPIQNGSPRKKVKRRQSIDLSEPYIALGTTSGLLLIYSITKAELDVKIDSDTSESINCLSWEDGTEVYSAANQTILCWELKNKSLKSKWKASKDKITSILVIPEYNQLLSASKNIKLWDLESKEVLRTFVGHSFDVSHLLYLNPGKSDLYFISGSKGDRNLSCWNLNDDSRNAVANFLMEDIAVSISAAIDSDGCTRLAAVTRSGVCHVYQHVLNGRGSKPIKPKRTIQVTPSTFDSKDTVKIIPILSSLVNDDFTVKIAHGFTIFLVFENVVLDSAGKIHCLIRADPRKTAIQSETQVSKVKTPLVDNKVHYLTPHTASVPSKRKPEGTSEVPMEKRLENLTLKKLDSSSVVPGSNVAQLLLQGLHSKDKHILSSVLTNKDENVIKNTVKRLPINVIVPLVQELTSLVQGKTLSCQIGASWLKIVLQIHAGLLVSNPDLSSILSPVLGSIESRLSLQMPLCRLRGRLDLLVSQVNLAAKTDNVDNDEAVLVYNDKASSDSEIDMIEVGGQSESENEWNEDSDNEVDGEDNSEEEMST